MAFLPGLKKQFNKANQFMTERITGKLKCEFDKTGYTTLFKRGAHDDSMGDHIHEKKCH